jgi:hypothetical protein
MRVRILASVVAALVVAAGVITFGQDPPAPKGEQLQPAPGPAPVGETADPMQVVEDFVQRGRETAAQHVASLTEERDRLRARLERVEAALQRWDAVNQALGVPTPDPAADAPPPNEPAEVPAPPAEEEPSPAPAADAPPPSEPEDDLAPPADEESLTRVISPAGRLRSCI